MQIIIDKETLTTAFAIALFFISGCDYTNTEKAVDEMLGKIGYVSLPETHGRIVDVNKMEYLKAIHDAKYGKISWSEAIKQIKNSAPTIVEANNTEKRVAC